MSDIQNARARHRAIIDEREAESCGDLYDSDSDCCASEGHAVLPDVAFEDCASVLNARALTIHAQRHEAALDAATQRIAVLEKMVDRLNNIVTPLMFDYDADAITMEQWHAQFEGLEGAPADERYVYHVLDFCEGAIRDAITLEDGLDAAAGEAVLRMIAAAKAQRAAPPTGTGKHADAEIDAIEECARAVAIATNVCSTLEDERALVKARCIQALIGTPNPLSKTGAEPHSASSAEKIVEEHADYAAHRALQRDAEVGRWLALGRYEAQKRRADLALACPDRPELLVQIDEMQAEINDLKANRDGWVSAHDRLLARIAELEADLRKAADQAWNRA